MRRMTTGFRKTIMVIYVAAVALMALSTSFAICLCGLFMTILDLPLNYGKKRKNHNLLHLGIFSLCIGG